MRATAQQLGFDVSVLKPVQQAGCSYPAAVTASSALVASTTGDDPADPTSINAAETVAVVQEQGSGSTDASASGLNSAAAQVVGTGESQVVEPTAAAALPAAAVVGVPQGPAGVAEGVQVATTPGETGPDGNAVVG